jgi:hypothetical protein
MLAHEMAAVYALGMRLVAKANAEIERVSDRRPNQAREASIETCRLTNAAARMFASYQDGMLALQRFRSGGKQRVIVTHQHVEVNDGGQAVVAGNMKAGGKSGARKRRGREAK